MQHTEQVQVVTSGAGDSANKPDVSGKACNARGDRVRAMLRVRFGDDIYSSWFASMEFDNFDGRVVRASVLDDEGDGRKGLHVVHHRGAVQKARYRGERGL